MEAEKKKSRYNQKKNQYVQEFIRKNYGQIMIRLPKEGEITREKVAEMAEAKGMSMNAFIIDAIRAKIREAEK